MKTKFLTKEECEKNRRWLEVDAEGQILGKLATRIAMALMGKDRPEYTPNVDTGAYVIVTNGDKVRLTGRKMEQKTYESFSGYPGGHKVMTVTEMLERHPDRVIKDAVRRMLPKTKLGKTMLKKLKVYVGTDHPHTYHKPEKLEI
jgi:large subunit ribosomal protein L13